MKKALYWARGVAVLLLGTSVSWAQQMVLPTHEVPSPDVAAAVLRGDQPRVGIIKLGPFDFIPGFESSVYYDDNVGAQEVNEEEAIVLTLAPSIELAALDWEDGMGKQMRIDYSPGFYFFFGDDVSDRNRVNHTANISGRIGGSKLVVGFDQGLRFTTGPVIDLGSSADRMLYTTRLTSRYTLSAKTSIDVNADFRVLNYNQDQYTDTYNIANDNWINYLYSPKLRLGLGLTIGYTGIEDQPDQTYQQLQARAVYAIAEKVDLQATVGGEWRQFKSGIDDTLNPVWNLSAAYRPRDSTTFQISVFQRYEASSRAGNQSYLYTGVTGSVRQMLMQRLALNISGTYSFADYEATTQGAQATREDDLYIFRTSVDFYIRPGWTAGLFYDYSLRDSTIPELEFERNRVGLQTAWIY